MTAIELQAAQRMGVSTIVIEATNFGEEITQFIYMGNFLHKSSVISGLLCILLDRMHSHSNSAIYVTGLISLSCAALYMFSWQFDPCCKYQPETDIFRLRGFPVHALQSCSPVVLVKRDDTRRKILHTLLAGLSACIVLVRTINKINFLL